MGTNWQEQHAINYQRISTLKSELEQEREANDLIAQERDAFEKALEQERKARIYAESCVRDEIACTRKAEQRAADLQAKIDALMQEHCPDEMTPEQVSNWQAHQQPEPKP